MAIFILFFCVLLLMENPYFSRTEFCALCHEMNQPYQEYIKSSHFNNPSGVRASGAAAGCAPFSHDQRSSTTSVATVAPSANQ